MNKNNEHDGSQNIEDEDIDIDDGAPADDASQEDKDAYYSDLKEKNKQLFARAKKAEGFILKDGKWVKAEKPAPVEKKPSKKKDDDDADTPEPSSTEKLTSTDAIAIMRNNVPEEDVESVVEYAQFKKISVAEALKTGFVKAMLAESAEMRKTADASATGDNRRGGRVSDETILANAKKGILPESDADMDRLVALRRKGLRKS